MSNTLEAKLKLDIAELIANQAKAQQETKKWIDELRSEGKRGAQAVDTISAATKRATDFVKAGQAAGRIQLGGVAMQAQDIAVQLQMGTQASIVLAQQGSQILSAFGTGGAIAGGVLAIGGAFFTMAQKSRENFDAMKADADGFADRMKASLTGSSSEIATFFTEVRTGVSSAYSDIESLQSGWSGIGARMAALFGGPSVADRERQANDLAIQKANALATIQTTLLARSADEVKIAELKAAGNAKAAEAMQRQLNLQREIQRIQGTQFDPKAKEKLIADATRKNQLAGVTPVDAAAVKAQAAKQREELQTLRGEAKKMAVDMLPDDKRLDALKVQLEEVLMGARMRNIGMSIGTAADLKDVAASHRRDGNISGETEALRSYKQALTIQQDIQRLQDHITTDAKRAADLAKDKARTDMEAALRIKREQDAWIAQRNGAVQGSADEMALLKARNTRRKSDDYRVERDIAIRSRRDRFMREEGLSAEEATARATQMRDMEEKASGTGRIRHTGIKRGMGRNLDTFFAQQGKAWGVNAPGESAFTKLQRQGFGWEKDLIPGMAGRQARNEAAQNRAPAGTPTVALSNREIEILTRIADGIIGFVTN